MTHPAHLRRSHRSRRPALLIGATAVPVIAALVVAAVFLRPSGSPATEFEQASHRFNSAITGPHRQLAALRAEGVDEQDGIRNLPNTYRPADAARAHKAASSAYQRSLGEIDFPERVEPHVARLVDTLKSGDLIMTNVAGNFTPSGQARVYALYAQVETQLADTENDVRTALR